MKSDEAPVQVLRGSVILPDRVLEGGLVVVAGGLIQAVSADATAYAVTHDLGTRFICPGFLDVHTHGIAGADTMDATPEALSLMARRYAAHGVTGFVPTTVTQSQEATLAAVRQVRAYMQAQPEQPAQVPAGPRARQDPVPAPHAQEPAPHAQEPAPHAQEPCACAGARLLGLHLEGPWISAQYKGAQNERYISPPDEELAGRLLEAAKGAVRIVTLAPELPGAEGLIRRLRRHGVAVSLGHSAATYDQAAQAVAWGATQVTHCFNAMTGLHHRRPGLAGAALALDGLYAEIIADGVHVHPAVMRLLVRAKGRERVILITDSMAAAELADGTYALGGQEVRVQDGQARLLDGTLAGSTLTLDAAVRNLVTLCQVPLVDAVYMAATTPAQALGLAARKGRLGAGYDADLAIMEADLRPAMTMIGGRIYPAGPHLGV